MRIDECYFLGTIGRAHGTKGEVKVYLDVDYIDEYSEMESVYVHEGNKLTPFFIDQIRIIGTNQAIVWFKDHASREQAESLSGRELYLPLDCLPDLQTGQFYYHDVVGFKVEDEELGPLGEVLRFEESSPYDLMVTGYQGVEVLIPVSYRIVPEADFERRTMITRLPPGLIEIYLGEDEES